MNSTSLPHISATRLSPADSAGQWLNALASGACTQDEFLAAIRQLQARDPEVTWEVLSLLDQFTRRKRITRDVSLFLKSKLQQDALGSGTDVTSVKAADPAPPKPAAPTPVPTPRIVAAPPPPSPAPASRPAAALAQRRTPQAGDLLRGRYGIIQVISSDASGMLVEAMDELMADVPGIRRRVAIRLIETGGQREPALIQRIYSLQSLAHPGIVRVFEVDEEHGTLFLMMELLTGMSLRQLGASNGGGRLPSTTAHTIVRTVASALAYMHSRNVFHGDVSVDNVLITDVGEVRLQGFEIRGRGLAANAVADRLAFAWLAYDVLSGLNAAGAEPGARPAQLREPPGLTRQQWQRLRDTLLGKDEPGADALLDAFAGGDTAASGHVMLLPATQTPAPHRGVISAVAIAVVVALAGTFGYLYFNRDILQTDTASAAVIAQSVPDTRSAAPVAEVPQPTPDAVPSVEAERVPAVEAPPSPAPAAAPPPLPTGRALIDISTDAIQVSADQTAARVWVRRRGGLNGDVTFVWWTENGSAQADRDFGMVPPQRVVIPSGAKGVALLVPLVSDPLRNEPGTFYVKIDAAGQGATLGERTLAQVAIVPSNR